MKRCSKCKLEKPVTDFGKSAKYRDGLRCECKACRKLSGAAYYAANKERHNSWTKAWYARNKDSHNAASRQWYAENRDVRSAQIKAYVAANPEKVRVRQKRWAQENRELLNAWKRSRYAEDPEKFRAEFRAWRAANPEKAKAAVKAWARENPDRVKAQTAKYRACKLNRTPCWLRPEHKAAIVEIYECARLLELLMGEPYEVDHIVPLQGKLVSGLHVPWNLQILTASENSRKGNKFEVE